MTDAQLNEILAYCEAATPGPWETRFVHRMFESTRRNPCVLMENKIEQDWPDSDFIARARTDLPAVVRELLEAQKEIHAACKYFFGLTDGAIGCGDTPVQALIGAHIALREKLGEARAGLIAEQKAEIASLQATVRALTLYPAEPAEPKHSATQPAESKSGS